MTAEEIRADYELLGELLKNAEGSGAAAIVRERRQVRKELARLGASEEVTLVDELAVKRAGAGVVRPPARRSQSG